MQYALEISEVADKKLKKLETKNRQQLKIVSSKVKQILKDPYHFKPLRGDLHGSRRTHIGKSFVLIYEIDEKKKVIRILDYGHHDTIY